MATLQTNIDRPLRVVAYTDSAGVGGAEISLGHLVAHVSQNIDVTVVGVSQLVVDAIASRRPQASRVVLPATGVPAIAAHISTLRRLSPDVVHINLCTPWAGATGLFAALMLRSARVVRVDQLPLRTTDALKLWRTRSLSLRVDAHVSVGEASARRMEDFYALGRGTIISIPNCVPNLEDNPEPPKLESLGQLVIGSVGRLDRMKGHDVLLQAIAQVEGVRVIIFGEGQERTALEQLASDLGVSDRVSLPGWVDDPRTYLSTFDVMVLPSRSEGFPLVVVEAMLAARPVVATRVGSVAEAVSDGNTGLLVDKDDVEGLATALRLFRDNPELCRRLGKQAREVALSCFTVEKMVSSYEKLWYKIVNTQQVPRLYVKHPPE